MGIFMYIYICMYYWSSYVLTVYIYTFVYKFMIHIDMYIYRFLPNLQRLNKIKSLKSINLKTN